jgi:hypothetical protein
LGDVSYHGGTAATLIQYKRAYVDGSVWAWHLNRTKRRDQRARLPFLASLGYPVFYALPNFAAPSELIASRRRLLAATFWYSPSYIVPPEGPVGHHEVTHDRSTGKWQVSSPDSIELHPPLAIGDVINAMETQVQQQVSIEEFAGATNRVMLATDAEFSQAGDQAEAEMEFHGQGLVVRHS